MATKKRSALSWTARALGVATVLLLAVFAVDVFGEGNPPGEVLVALFIHLIPSLMIAVALAVAWRWERLGGGLYIFLGSLYIWMFWIPGEWVATMIISGPLFLTGMLFLVNAWVSRDTPNPEKNERDSLALDR
jgi:hypothetical protein